MSYKVNARGWAYSERKDALREQYSTRYEDIKHLRRTKHINWSNTLGYGQRNFTGKLLSEEAKKLTALDILIIMDSGNLCFGGHITRKGDKFHGCYYTG